MHRFFGKKPSSEENRGLLDHSLTTEQSNKIEEMRDAIKQKDNDNVTLLLNQTTENGDFAEVVIESGLLQTAANQYYEEKTLNTYNIIKTILLHDNNFDKNITNLNTSPDKTLLEQAIRENIRRERSPQRQNPASTTTKQAATKISQTERSHNP